MMYAPCTQALAESLPAESMDRQRQRGDGRYWARTSDLRLVEAEAAGTARNAKAQKGSTYADSSSARFPCAATPCLCHVRTVYRTDLVEIYR